jgi:hypothetical protein
MKLAYGRKYLVKVIRRTHTGLPSVLEEEFCEYDGMRHGRHVFIGSDKFGEDFQRYTVSEAMLDLRVVEAPNENQSLSDMKMSGGKQ